MNIFELVFILLFSFIAAHTFLATCLLPRHERVSAIILDIELASLSLAIRAFDVIDLRMATPTELPWILANGALHGAMSGVIGGLTCDLLLAVYMLIELNIRESFRFMAVRIVAFSIVCAVAGSFIVSIPFVLPGYLWLLKSVNATY